MPPPNYTYTGPGGAGLKESCSKAVAAGQNQRTRGCVCFKPELGWDLLVCVLAHTPHSVGTQPADQFLNHEVSRGWHVVVYCKNRAHSIFGAPKGGREYRGAPVCASPVMPCVGGTRIAGPATPRPRHSRSGNHVTHQGSPAVCGGSQGIGAMILAHSRTCTGRRSHPSRLCVCVTGRPRPDSQPPACSIVHNRE